MYMLEERILFDGAAAADVTEAEAQAEQQTDAQPEAQQDNQTTEQDPSEQQDASADEASGDSPANTTESGDSTTYSELDTVLNEFLTQSGTETENNPGVLIISSLIDDADTLAAAAKDNVIVVRYDAETTTLDQLLGQVRDSLDGREASSIGIAAHDYGDAKFYLTSTETISLGSTLASESQREFWTEMGSMLAENGRIDLFACGLASSETGLMLVSSLENISGINFAASTDSTGNLVSGGDWMLETDNVDLADTYFDKDRLDDFSGLLASEVKKLTASDAAMLDYFGYSVSISGDYAVVSADENDDDGTNSGSAYIFYKDQGGLGNWGELKKLTASDAEVGDFFGISVSISGDYAIVGASENHDAGVYSGSAYIFYKDQGGIDNWGEVKKLTASDADAYDRFGCSVSIDGDYALIGAYNCDAGTTSGAAYIFYKDQGGIDNWGEVKKLAASDADPAAKDYFGYSVSISGTYALIGAHVDDDCSGSAYIFYKDQGGIDNWGEVKKLTASDADANDHFGYSVSISGTYAIIGAYQNDDTGINSGSAYIFYKDQEGIDNWGEIKKLTAPDADADDYFGYSVSISGTYAIVGAYLNDSSGTDSGSAYLFCKDQGGANNWGLAMELTASDAGDRDYFGYSVSASNNTIFVGAPFNNDAGDDSGSAYIINITNIPSLLTNTSSTLLSYTEGDSPILLNTSIVLSDADDANLESATVQITGNYQNGADVLSFVNTANITGTWNAATGTLTLTGSDTVANYQTALRAVKYANTSNDPNTTQRTVSFIVNDGDDNSNTVTRNIDITAISDENEGGDEGSEDEVPPTGIDDGTSNNGLPDNDDENSGNGNGNDNQGNNGNHNNNWGYYNHLFDIMQNFRGQDIFSVVNELAHNGHFQVSDNWEYQGQLDLSNIFNNPNTNIQNAWQYFLSNGMPDGENGNYDIFFNLGDGEDFSEYQFQDSGDGDEFALLEASTCSRFANTDIFEKHPLFKTDYEKALDELIAV